MTATMALRSRTDWLARLRTIMVLRGGQRVVNIPGGAVSVSRRALSSGEVDWWLAGGASTPVAVYQPKGAASLAASYVNLANPGTYDAAPGVAPTHASATGWAFNGAAYLTTGVVPASGWSMLVRFNGYSTGATRYFAGGGAYNAIMRIGHTSTNFTYDNGSSTTAGSSITTTAVVGVAGQEAYKNGVNEGITLGAWGATNTYDVFVGCRNYLGSPGGYYVGNILAIAIYDSVLNASQVAAVSAAMAAL